MKTKEETPTTPSTEAIPAIVNTFHIAASAINMLPNKMDAKEFKRRSIPIYRGTLVLLTFFCNVRMAIPVIAFAIPEITSAIPCVATAIPINTKVIPFIANVFQEHTNVFSFISTVIPCNTKVFKQHAMAFLSIANVIPCNAIVFKQQIIVFSGIAIVISGIAKNTFCITESRNQNQHYKLPLPNT